MNRLIVLLALALLLAPLASLGLRAAGWVGDGERPPRVVVRPPTLQAVGARRSDGAPPAPPSAPPPAPLFRQPGEDSLFRAAAETAWRYVEQTYHPRTGLVNSVISYPYATVWDMASGLAALYSAHELGLVKDAEYDRRMTRALTTLREMRLYDETAFNKNYQVASATPAGRNDRDTPRRADGYGWSATDLGRLLVWLKIIAADQPRHAQAAEAVVRRLDLEEIVRDGYLWGESLNRRGRERSYQEGRIGYEQYAAAGFALWGAYADRALSLEHNADSVEVLGVPLLADRRAGAHLTSEPFILMGLELGWWDGAWERQARQLLAAQEARARRTGRLTIVSEDALPVPPYYFYYYTVYDSVPFAVRALGRRVPNPPPRWVSTKAAFGWYALMPGEYTWRAVQTVAERARGGPGGWSSGVYEASGKPTGSPNINTAAVVLEAALYHARRRPLLAAAAAPDSLPTRDTTGTK